MEDNFEPKTEPAGDLDPPASKPTTAVGTAEAPGPDDGGGTRVRALLQSGQSSLLGKWVNAVLDTVDVAADLARDTFLSVTRR
jgi:hypothetical protein